MPKPRTFLTLYDEVLKLEISKLNKWGYLKPGQFKEGLVSWVNRDGTKLGEIAMRVDTRGKHHHVELNYKYGGRSIAYKIPLVSIPSNLGRGKIRFFLCPQTGKRCRKLFHNGGGGFWHREAFKHGMYSIQVQAKNDREGIRQLNAVNRGVEAYSYLNTKWLKTFYTWKGIRRPTRRYKKLLRILEQSNKVSQADIELLYIK